MRVRWMLEEFGIAYEINPIQSRTGETKTDTYTAINSKQKIPSQQHGDFVLTESPAIVTYLAENFEPPPRLLHSPEQGRTGDAGRMVFFHRHGVGCAHDLHHPSA